MPWSNQQDGIMTGFRGLRTLLIFHGVVTLLAAIMLFVSPSLIPGMAGVRLAPDAYLMAYLLAGAEFGIAFLSFGGSRLGDPGALRLIAGGCIVFHATSAVLESYAAYRGAGNPVLVANVVARLIIMALFVVFLRRTAT